MKNKGYTELSFLFVLLVASVLIIAASATAIRVAKKNKSEPKIQATATQLETTKLETTNTLKEYKPTDFGNGVYYFKDEGDFPKRLAEFIGSHTNLVLATMDSDTKPTFYLGSYVHDRVVGHIVVFREK